MTRKMNKKISEIGVKERFDLIIKQLGISGREFSKSCGFSESYYSSISDGIGADKLNKIISKYPSISVRWIITGEGEMLRNLESSMPAKNIDDPMPIVDELRRQIAEYKEEVQSLNREIGALEQQLADLKNGSTPPDSPADIVEVAKCADAG